MASTMDEVRRRLRTERRDRDRALGAYTAARQAEGRAQERLEHTRAAVKKAREDAKRIGVPASDIALADEVMDTKPHPRHTTEGQGAAIHSIPLHGDTETGFGGTQ